MTSWSPSTTTTPSCRLHRRRDDALAATRRRRLAAGCRLRGPRHSGQRCCPGCASVSRRVVRRRGHPRRLLGGVEQSGFDSVTQYELWKAIWSGLNDGNLFVLLDHALGRHNQLLEEQRRDQRPGRAPPRGAVPFVPRGGRRAAVGRHRQRRCRVLADHRRAGRVARRDLERARRRASRADRGRRGELPRALARRGPPVLSLPALG